MLICRTLESIVWTLSNIFLMGDCPIDALKGFICPQCLLYEGEILNYDTLLCSPRVGGEFTPRIYNYIFLPPTPSPPTPYLHPTIPASRPWFRGHGKKSLEGDYIGAGLRVLPPCEIQTGVLFLPTWKYQANEIQMCRFQCGSENSFAQVQSPSLDPCTPWCTPWCVTPDDCVTCPNWSLISTTGDSQRRLHLSSPQTPSLSAYYFLFALQFKIKQSFISNHDFGC